MLGLAFCCFCHVRYDYNREFDCYVLPSNSSIGKRGLPVNFFRNCIKSKFALCLVDSVKSWLKCFFCSIFKRKAWLSHLHLHYRLPHSVSGYQISIRSLSNRSLVLDGFDTNQLLFKRVNIQYDHYQVKADSKFSRRIGG